MNLHLLRRLRRMMRRRYLRMNPSDREALGLIEEWSGRSNNRKKRTTMKAVFYLLLALILAVLVFLQAGCVQSTVTRPLPGGGAETTVTKGLSDRAAGVGVAVGGRLLDAYLPPRVERGGK
jgi:predicted anti-sigma-YlaC factor YlaD